MVSENRETRPDVPENWGSGPWEELLILPFDSRMSRENDNGWLQWGPEDFHVIPRWLYTLMCILWPVMRFSYRDRLIGQSTDC